jgi:hypothetical protein
MKLCFSQPNKFFFINRQLILKNQTLNKKLASKKTEKRFKKMVSLSPGFEKK